MPDFDFDESTAALKERWGERQITDKDVLSHALYPSVFDEWQQFKEVYGDVQELQTHLFLKPMKEGEEVELKLEPGKEMITMPSAHFLGLSDEILSQERLNRIPSCCVDAEVVRHPGGHAVPRLTPAIAEAVESVVQKAAQRTGAVLTLELDARATGARWYRWWPSCARSTIERRSSSPAPPPSPAVDCLADVRCEQPRQTASIRVAACTRSVAFCHVSSSSWRVGSGGGRNATPPPPSKPQATVNSRRTERRTRFGASRT